MKETEAIVQQLTDYNRAYREGKPLVSDAEYDVLVEKLRQLDPGHPFLRAVEPERFTGKREVRHPMAMLSLEKAYTREQLERFLARIEKEALILGLHDPEYQITPKLDGLAGRDDGQVFATRGNGWVGYEISSAFDKGVVPVGGRGQGLGEIVVVQSYFEENLADRFEHPRNMVVGIVSSDTLNEDARKALDEKKVHFVPYAQLPRRRLTAAVVLEDLDGIVDALAAETDYPMDGVVVEVLDEALRDRLGATSHHYRWQIAVKRKGRTAVTTVENILWQVGRTGNVTPVLEVAPVSLSGATIRRVTAHHAGMVAKHKLGPGSRIEIIRSGEVIPKLEAVVEAHGEIVLPEKCPACKEPLVWVNDFLRCTNPNCSAQIEQRISHWFKTLGNADWFGIKTIEKLVAGGYDSLEKIYGMGVEDFSRLGFGPVQSVNLAQALQTSRTKQIEDWRFLAAFGLPNLGVGDSRKLLQFVSLEDLLNVQPQEIAAINGFGDKTSNAICEGLKVVRPTFTTMLALGFNLEKSPLDSEKPGTGSILNAKKVVFSGKMVRGSREQMQAQARQLGAVVQSSVNSTTDYLVCGEKVGQAKLEKAKRLNVKILSEEMYNDLINER